MTKDIFPDSTFHQHTLATAVGMMVEALAIMAILYSGFYGTVRGVGPDYTLG